MVPECSRCSRCSQPCNIKQERKPTTSQDKTTRNEKGKGKGKGKGNEKPREPIKKGTPPLLQGAGSPSPHHKFAPKNQQKVAWGGFEKIFGKIFRGNVSGERKTPRVISTEGGCLVNLTNHGKRRISNLAMQITKTAQKHYLITEGKGRQKKLNLQGY